MLRTYLLLRPAPNSLEALVQYYRDKDVIAAAVPYGLQVGELAHPVQNADTLAVVSVWPSQNSYNCWLAAPEREALIEGMLPLLGGPEAITGWSRETDDGSAADFTVLFGDRTVSVRIRTDGQAPKPL
jgi:heme-degrading monooxygenase HmoA